MYLQEVNSKIDIRNFLGFPQNIYQNDPNYIRPLDQDIEEIFDRKINNLFQNEFCVRWLLYDDFNQIIGRIAAFTYNKNEQDFSTGGIGFFECVDSQEAADFMFKHCEKWLKNFGVEAMDGPINFGNRMNFWGLLVEGFFSPIYGMNYNPPYYQRLFENYGFKIHFTQSCYRINIKNKFPNKFYNISNVITRNPSYKLQTINKRNLPKFAQDFTTIYNKAWQKHSNQKAMETEDALKIFKKMKLIMDEKLIWFAYHNDIPIGFWINLPDVNSYLKHVKANLDFYSKMKFLWRLKFSKSKKFIGILFGIVPEFQNKGIDAFLITKALEVINNQTYYEDFEVQWIGDFNPKMQNIIKHLEGQRTRTLVTYRYIFDRNKTFKIHSKI